MNDYRTMSPCERIKYYREQIKRLKSNRTSDSTFMLEALHTIIRDNRNLCPDFIEKTHK
jgi:hypothetical protein